MLETDVELNGKYDTLVSILKEMGQVVVAMSGGVDSVLLAKVACDTLGENALTITADSPSIPRRELADAVALAEKFGFHHRIIQTDEVDDLRYKANPVDRCYYCKDILFDQLDAIAHEFEASWVCFGENLDDQLDHRPGSLAAREHRVRAPLKEAGLGKSEIRRLASELGLPVWDKPASACLASRFPYGMEITPEKLAQVEAAEDYLHDLGFELCRVRHHGDIARIEVPLGEIAKLLPHAQSVHERMRQFGFKYAAVDLGGYRLGSLNEAAPILPPVEIREA